MPLPLSLSAESKLIQNALPDCGTGRASPALRHFAAPAAGPQNWNQNM